MDVVSISGPSGTGKSTLARAVAKELDAVLLSRDPLMAVLLASGVPRRGMVLPRMKSVPEIGHDLQTALLVEQLAMGRSAVLECIASRRRRAMWRDRALEAGARFWSIETTCSDPDLHVRRLEARDDLPPRRGRRALRRRVGIEIDPNASYIADAVQPVEDHARSVVDMIRTAAS